MDNLKIIFITHGHFEMKYLLEIADDVEITFQNPVSMQEINLEIGEFYDPSRRQYNGNELLEEISNIQDLKTTKKIGLFQVDLFIPILTYIFGQSIYQGNTGIASFYRLKNEQYGMKPDQNILYNRFKKVIIHELGHMFGLIHCYVPNCVMRSSTYVEDIDQKKHTFCNKCHEIIAVNK